MKRLMLFVLLLAPLVACSKSTPTASPEKATMPPVTMKPTVDPCTLMPKGPHCPTPGPKPVGTPAPVGR